MKTRQQNGSRATLATNRTCRNDLSAIIKRTSADSHGGSSVNSAMLVSCTSIIYRGTGCTVTAFGDQTKKARRMILRGKFREIKCVVNGVQEELYFRS